MRGTGPPGPAGAKGLPDHGTVEGKDNGCNDIQQRLHETTTDRRTGQDPPGSGIHLPGLPHGPGLDEGSLRAHPQGWGDRGGRRDGQGVRGKPGVQPPGPPEPGQERRHLQGSASPENLHPERRWQPTPAGHSHLRGQGPAKGRGDGDGAALRAGLPGLFLRVQARTFRAHGAGGDLAGVDGHGRGLGARRGYPQVFRYFGPREAAGDPRPADEGRRAEAPDRQVAQGGSPGEGMHHAPGNRISPGRGHQSHARQHLPPRSAGRVVRKGGQAPIAWSGLPGALRGRFRDGLLPGRKMPGGSWMSCPSGSSDTA